MAIVPKYYQIKTDILSRIEDGSYPAQQLLPPEKKMMEYYAVSRITVRKALDELASEGYLYKVQGKGTYVGDSRKRGISIARYPASCIAELTLNGFDAKRVVIQAKIVDCEEALAEQYGLEPGERYFLFERLYTGDGIPYSYEISFYLYRLVPGIEDRDFENESIHSILRDANFDSLSKNRTTKVQAILSQDKLSGIFEIEDGRPLLYMKAHSYFREGGQPNGKQKCIEASEAIWRTDIIPVTLN